jgi:hypothetical protein
LAVASAWGSTNLRYGDEIVTQIAETFVEPDALDEARAQAWRHCSRRRRDGRKTALEPQAVKKALSTRSRIVALTP